MGRKRTIRAVLVTLILTTLIVGGLAFFFGSSIIREKDIRIKDYESQVSQIQAYAFARDIKAGSVITPSDIQTIQVTNSSKSFGMLLFSGQTTTDEDNNVVEWAEYFTAQTPRIDAKGNIVTDSKGNQVMDDVTTSVKLKDMVYGRIIKNNVSKNTLVMDSLFYVKDDVETRDERIEEMSSDYMSIPSNLDENDYFDLRIRYADGSDYTVLVGKRVTGLGTGEGGAVSSKSFYTKLSEEERMVFDSALIEAFINDGASLYGVRYVDPSTQLFKETIEDYVEKYENGIKLAIEAKEIEQILAMMAVSGDATREAYDALPEEQKEAYRRRISAPVREENLTDAEIAAYAGIAVEHASAIRLAKQEKSENNPTLNYYRKMKVKTKTPLARTYAVTAAVLRVVQANPNIADEVKYAFAQKAETRVARDMIRELEAKYEAAPASKDGIYSNDVKTKDDIQAEIDSLTKKYGENYEKVIKSQQERRDYLISLIYGN